MYAYQKLKYPHFIDDHRLECGGQNISKFIFLYAMSYSSLVLYTVNLLWLKKSHESGGSQLHSLFEGGLATQHCFLHKL